MGEQSSERVRRADETDYEVGRLRIDFTVIKTKKYNIHKKNKQEVPERIQILSSLLNAFEHSAGWFIYQNVDYRTTISLLKFLGECRRDPIVERNKVASDYFSRFCNSILEVEKEYESGTTTLSDIIDRAFNNVI